MRHLSLILALCCACVLAEEQKSWKWEKTVAEIESLNATVESNAVVFVGSSSIAKWDTLTNEFPGYKVLNRGFGGSSVSDQLRALDRIVIPIAPKIVGYYCGDNNLTKETSDPQVAVDGFVEWLDRVHAALPKTVVLYLSIKPSPKRKAAWPRAVKANAMIKEICDQRDRVIFVDVVTPLLTAAGEMQPEL